MTNAGVSLPCPNDPALYLKAKTTHRICNDKATCLLRLGAQKVQRLVLFEQAKFDFSIFDE